MFYFLKVSRSRYPHHTSSVPVYHTPGNKKQSKRSVVCMIHNNIVSYVHPRKIVLIFPKYTPTHSLNPAASDFVFLMHGMYSLHATI